MTVKYGNYVKFLRCTTAIWETLTSQDKNNDTLYFVTNPEEAYSKLYLGEKLVADGNLKSATAIEDLNNVLVDEGITNQSLLVYDSATKKWINKSVLDVIGEITAEVDDFVGATETNDGIAGLVPAPTTSERLLFLRADATWANPVDGISDDLQALQTKVDNLVGVGNEGKTIEELATEAAKTEIATILDGAPESFDTLKEIADWIAANPGSADVVELQNKVTALEETLNGVSGGDGTDGLVSVVSTLQEKISGTDGLENRVITLEEDNVMIKKSIQWGEISID